MSMTGKAEILKTTKGRVPENVLQLIELAGRTCYKSSDKITADSAERFVQMLMARGHESVLEHSWIVFKVVSDFYNFPAKIAEQGSLLSLSQSSEYEYIISGNIRMFLDFIRKWKSKHSEFIINSLINELLNSIPIVFDDFKPNNCGRRNSCDILFYPYDSPLFPLDKQWSREEQIKHFWAMVRFTGCSRAFTHQLVRHRRMAISQESQRYCDESGFYTNGYLVVPPSIIEVGLEQDYIDKMRQMDQFYQDYLKIDGIKREDARFLLPNAVCSEIVISCNLEEWRHIFKMRCDTHAQWEIRAVMMQLLPKFQELFPDCFDDFVISENGKSAKMCQ